MRGKEACGGRSAWKQMRGNQGDKDAAPGEEEVHYEMKSRGNGEVKGPEPASCLTLSPPPIAPGERPPTASPPRGRQGISNAAGALSTEPCLLFTTDRPLSWWHFAAILPKERMHPVLIHQAFIRRRRRLVCMLRSPR